MVKTREATAADAAALVALNHAFNHLEVSPEHVIVRLTEAGTETVFVADDGPDIAGFACLQVTRSVCYDHPRAELTELYIAPDHRRRGVGRALVEMVVQAAKEAGAAEIVLATSGDNEAARRLYQACGFASEGDVYYTRVLGKRPW